MLKEETLDNANLLNESKVGTGHTPSMLEVLKEFVKVVKEEYLHLIK